MKVVFFTTSASYNGGAILCLLPMIEELKKVGVEPYVVLKAHGTTEDKLRQHNIPYTIIKSYDWLIVGKDNVALPDKIKWLGKRLMNCFAEIKMRKFLKQIKPDILHFNSVYAYCGARSAKKLGIPVVWHIREFVQTNEFNAKYLDKKLFAKIMSEGDRYIAVSEAIYKEFSKFLPKNKFDVVYDGVQVDNTDVKAKTPSNPFVISMLGTVFNLKGHIDGIKAVKILKDRGIECVLNIYGKKINKNYYSELVEYIRNNSISENVNFIDFTENIAEVYGSSDAILVASRSEAFGRVAAEAMQSLRLVIGADNTGTSELIDNEKYGLLYETGNPNMLADKIEYAINNDMTDTVAMARQNAVEKYSVAENARGVLSVFEKVSEK